MTTSVLAFYGFKGGTGRSYILAHVAATLASLDKKVLLIDADLEAPGIGDFFDAPGKTKFERWRGQDGLMDVIRRLASDVRHNAALSGEELANHVGLAFDSAFDEKTGHLVPLTSQDNGTENTLPMYLFGPGNHLANSPLRSQTYIANFLNFDWNAFLRRGGPAVLGEIGSYLRSGKHGFDYILIDSRTGYNLASILMLQHWASHIVCVGSWSFQSIDGLARMLPICRMATGSGRSRLPTALVMNKTPPEDSLMGRMEQIHSHKKKLVAKYFEEQRGEDFERFDLPFCSRLQANDRMVFSELSWNEFEKYQNKRFDESADNKSDASRQINEEAALCEFALSIRGLTQWLGDGEEGLSSSKAFSRAFDVLRPTRLKESRFHIAGLNADFDKNQADPIESAVVSRIVDISSKHVSSQVNNAEEIELDVAKRLFQELGKEGRALARHLLLKHLERSQSDINIDKAKELYSNFRIGIDPTTISQKAVRQLGLFEEKSQIHLGASDAVTLHSAIRLTVMDGNSDDCRRAVDDVERFHGPYLQLAAVLRDCARLQEFDLNLSFEEVVSRHADVANRLVQIIRNGGAAVPNEWNEFGKWNLLDLVVPFLNSLSECLRRNEVREVEEHKDSFVAFGEAILGHLTDCSVWNLVEDGDDFDDFIRCRLQAHEYICSACALHERAQYNWSGLTAELSDELRRSLQLPLPIESKNWTWISNERLTEKDLEALSGLVLSVDLLALQKHGDTDALPLVENLVQRVLSHDMAVLHGDSDSPELAANWVTCLRKLHNCCSHLTSAGIGYPLVRRISRLNRNLVNERSKDPSYGITLTRLDQLGFATSPRLWSAQYDNESTRKTSDNARITMDGALAIKAGLYREGLSKLSELDIDSMRKREVSDVWRHMGTVFRFRAAALAQLGNLRKAVEYAERGHSLHLAGNSIAFRNRVKQRQLQLLSLAHAAGSIEDTKRFDFCINALSRTNKTVLELLNFDAGIDLLMAAFRSKPVPIEETLNRAIQRKVSILPHGPDEGACSWAGLQWHGSGVLVSGQPAAPELLSIEGFHSLALLGAIRAGNLDAGRRILQQWRGLTQNSDLRNENFTPIHHTHRAFLNAFQYLFGEKDSRDSALRHRKADIDENGEVRGQYYRVVFSSCGIDS